MNRKPIPPFSKGVGGLASVSLANIPVNLPIIEQEFTFLETKNVGLTDADVEQLAWAEMVHEQFMAQLERELALGLPFNSDSIPVCLMCRSPLNGTGSCDCCGQRADMPLPSNQFFLKF